MINGAYQMPYGYFMIILKRWGPDLSRGVSDSFRYTASVFHRDPPGERVAPFGINLMFPARTLLPFQCHYYSTTITTKPPRKRYMNIKAKENYVKILHSLPRSGMYRWDYSESRIGYD
jgi:hypothetical protein